MYISSKLFSLVFYSCLKWWHYYKLLANSMMDEYILMRIVVTYSLPFGWSDLKRPDFMYSSMSIFSWTFEYTHIKHFCFFFLPLHVNISGEMPTLFYYTWIFGFVILKYQQNKHTKNFKNVSSDIKKATIQKYT